MDDRAMELDYRYVYRGRHCDILKNEADWEIAKTKKDPSTLRNLAALHSV